MDARTISKHTPGPWHYEGPDMFGDYNIIGPADALAVAAVITNLRPEEEVKANAILIAAAPETAATLDRLRKVNAELMAALKAAAGYLTNAAIDLETGAPKKAALMTINGGLNDTRAAIARATGGTDGV